MERIRLTASEEMPFENVLGPKPFRPGTPRPDFSAHFSFRDCSAHFSGTARPFLLFFIYLFLGGGGGNLLFYSVYVHQNKIQETLFNVILIFRQGNREII